jgi:hypothetical protein
MVQVASHRRGCERESERERRRSNQPELDHDILLVDWQIDRKAGMQSESPPSLN